MAIVCLSSLRRCSDAAIDFVIHDDGCLDEDDIGIVLDKLGPVKIVTRREADARMAEELKRFPASSAFRRETCMWLKLCDTVYYNECNSYILRDSYALALQPIACLFSFPDPDTNMLYM